MPGVQIEKISMRHAGWRDPLEEYIEHVDVDYFAGLPETYFFSGHTHVQVSVKRGDKWYCNPGSVGQPRDGDPRAACAIFSDGEIHLQRTDYDIDEIASAMQQAGFDPYFYRDLYHGAHIGGGVSKFRCSPGQEANG